MTKGLLFGGAFNPPTKAHIDCARLAMEKVGYDHVPTKRSEYLDAMNKIMEAGLCEHPGGGAMLTGVGSDQNQAYRTYPCNED